MRWCRCSQGRKCNLQFASASVGGWLKDDNFSKLEISFITITFIEGVIVSWRAASIYAISDVVGGIGRSSRACKIAATPLTTWN